MKTGQSAPGLSLKNPAVRARLRKLALWAGALLVVCYAGGVTAGYLWLRHGRGVEDVRIFDVALFRVDAVRETLGRQHFARARTEAAEKKYQAAYISFASGLRQAPDDIPGRLDAAAFFRSVGAANQSLAVLEEGLASHPDDERLIRMTFDFLLSTGRSQYGLKLIQKLYPEIASGGVNQLVAIYQIRFTLNVEGSAAASLLLDKQPELRSNPIVAAILARVLWESGERLRALTLMRTHVDSQEADTSDYTQLVSWLSLSGQPEDALKIAQQACKKFPSSVAARVLLLEAQAAVRVPAGPSRVEVAAFLTDFKGDDEALTLLSTSAAQKGWHALTWMLYELAAVARKDLGLFALNHADALARHKRFGEFQDLLQQLEAQAGEGSAAFQMQLRIRQILAAASLNDGANVREYARRLAALVQNEPDRLETFRQFFSKAGLSDAVAELTSRTSSGKPANRRPDAGS